MHIMIASTIAKGKIFKTGLDAGLALLLSEDVIPRG